MVPIDFYTQVSERHEKKNTPKYSEELKPSAPHIHTNMPDIDNLSINYTYLVIAKLNLVDLV